jgi:Tfp pilus assembly protein PilO
MPEYRNFKNLQLDLGKRTAEYNAKYDYYASTDAIYFNLQSREEDLKKIDDALPTDSRLGKIIYFIQKTASENGVAIKSIFLSKSSSGTNENKAGIINNIAFSTSVLSDYPSLQRFIIALEKSSRIFEVNTITFSSSPSTSTSTSSTSTPPTELNAENEGHQTYDFNLTITTYSY